MIKIETLCVVNFTSSQNVEPNPRTSCGPYKPIVAHAIPKREENLSIWNEENHDTIGTIALDTKGHIAVGTSTNGLNHKIAGRVGDSPIPGAGGYADEEVGAASATGDGDVMMRFLPSFLAVEEMRRGAKPQNAAETAVLRIKKYYPKFTGAVIALDKHGNYGAACNGMEEGFPYYVANLVLKKPTLFRQKCYS